MSKHDEKTQHRKKTFDFEFDVVNKVCHTYFDIKIPGCHFNK